MRTRSTEAQQVEARARCPRAMLPVPRRGSRLQEEFPEPGSERDADHLLEAQKFVRRRTPNSLPPRPDRYPLFGRYLFGTTSVRTSGAATGDGALFSSTFRSTAPGITGTAGAEDFSAGDLSPDGRLLTVFFAGTDSSTTGCAGGAIATGLKSNPSRKYPVTPRARMVPAIRVNPVPDFAKLFGLAVS